MDEKESFLIKSREKNRVKRNLADSVATLLNAPLGLVFGLIMCFLGLVLYAYFAARACDPVQAGYVGSPNQLMPYFVIEVLGDYPGLPGVFLAALFSGALSSLSSGINALAANTLEDVLGNVLRNAQQSRKTLIAKIIVIIYGGLAIGLAYVIRNLTGPVTQISTSAFGAFGGPVAGLFFVGAIFPQVNWKGAFFGGLLAIAVNMWISVGAVIYGRSPQISPPVPLTGCTNTTMTEPPWTYKNTSISSSPYQYTVADRDRDSTVGHEIYESYGFFLYDLSYIWLGFIGFILAFILSLLISFATGINKPGEVDAHYIFPCCRWLWKSKLAHRIPPYRGFVDGKMKRIEDGSEMITLQVASPETSKDTECLEQKI